MVFHYQIPSGSGDMLPLPPVLPFRFDEHNRRSLLSQLYMIMKVKVFWNITDLTYAPDILCASLPVTYD